jgi:hypothetical protein
MNVLSEARVPGSVELRYPSLGDLDLLAEIRDPLLCLPEIAKNVIAVVVPEPSVECARPLYEVAVGVYH